MHDNPLLPFWVDAQKVLTEIGIKDIEFDLKSRDEITKLLIGIQSIYCDKDRGWSSNRTENRVKQQRSDFSARAASVDEIRLFPHLERDRMSGGQVRWHSSAPVVKAALRRKLSSEQTQEIQVEMLAAGIPL